MSLSDLKAIQQDRDDLVSINKTISSKAFCLSGSIGLDTKWVSLDCVPLTGLAVAPAVSTLDRSGPMLLVGAVQVALTAEVVVSLA